MNAGDKSFFYHSNCKEPGIVGIMEIVKEFSEDSKTHLLPSRFTFAKLVLNAAFRERPPPRHGVLRSGLDKGEATVGSCPRQVPEEVCRAHLSKGTEGDGAEGGAGGHADAEAVEVEC